MVEFRRDNIIKPWPFRLRARIKVRVKVRKERLYTDDRERNANKNGVVGASATETAIGSTRTRLGKGLIESVKNVVPLRF